MGNQDERLLWVVFQNGITSRFTYEVICVKRNMLQDIKREIIPLHEMLNAHLRQSPAMPDDSSDPNKRRKRSNLFDDLLKLPIFMKLMVKNNPRKKRK